MRILNLSAAMALVAAPAFADIHVTGDAEAGKDVFAKQCISCHVVVNDDGETLAGRKSKTGPNLYGVAMGKVGGRDDYRYGKSMVEAGDAGHIWTEENFVAYVQNPKEWLQTTLDDKKARAKMSFRVRDAEDAINLYAYLAAIGPEIEMEEDAEADSDMAPAPSN